MANRTAREEHDDVDVKESVSPEVELSEQFLSAQYRDLLRLVTEGVRRLDRLVFFFLIIEIILALSFEIVADLWRHSDAEVFGIIDLRLFPSFVPLTGMFIAVAFLSVMLRVQMEQRLFFFQLRCIERKLGLEGKGTFCAAELYWGGQKITCSSKVETLHYLNTADGRIGRIAHRVWTWAIPIWFFLLFCYLLVGWIANLQHYVF